MSQKQKTLKNDTNIQKKKTFVWIGPKKVETAAKYIHPSSFPPTQKRSEIWNSWSRQLER